MTLPKQRQGISNGFHVYRGYNEETTLGKYEQIIWASIRHMCASEIAKHHLEVDYQILDKDVRAIIAENIKLYIKQAYDFYSAASSADSNTSPLFYYYCFMNLAKALCEIKHPQFHKMKESYSHGLRWHPNPEFLVDMSTDYITIPNYRGIWHVLWEILAKKPYSNTKPTKLKIADLFACCPEVSSEYERAFGQDSKYVRLVDPDFLNDSSESKVWIKFSVKRHDLSSKQLSRKEFLDSISDGNNWYRQVIGPNDQENDLYTFELRTPKKITAHPLSYWSDLLMPYIRVMNVFVHPVGSDMGYFIPIQNHLPIPLNQLVLLYCIVFWLGSLVRYDPKSIAHLRDSMYWILIEGFVYQSCLCLLELFEWEFYQTETLLIT